MTVAARGIEDGSDRASDRSRESARCAPFLGDRVHRCDLLLTPDLPDEAYRRLFEIDLAREFDGVTAAWDSEHGGWRVVGPRRARVGERAD
jgi:hypothetical protein